MIVPGQTRVDCQSEQFCACFKSDFFTIYQGCWKERGLRATEIDDKFFGLVSVDLKQVLP